MSYNDTFKVDLNSYVKGKKLNTIVTVPKEPQTRNANAVESTFEVFLDEIDKYKIPINGPEAKNSYNKVCNILYKLCTLYEAGEVDLYVNDLVDIAQDENKNGDKIFDGSRMESALISILDGLKEFSFNLKDPDKYNDPERFNKWMSVTNKDPGMGILSRNFDFYSSKGKTIKQTVSDAKNGNIQKDNGLSR